MVFRESVLECGGFSTALFRATDFDERQRPDTVLEAMASAERLCRLLASSLAKAALKQPHSRRLCACCALSIVPKRIAVRSAP